MATSEHLKSLSEQFRRLRRIATSEGYSDELSRMVGELQVGYGTVTTMFEPNLVYRARPLSDNFLPQHIREFMNPPAEKIPNFGRANLPLQSLLYCSDSEFVALKEVGAEPGDRIGIAQLSLMPGQPLPQVFTVGEITHRHRTRRSLLRNSVQIDVFAQLSRLGIDLRHALLIDGFYADAFKSVGKSLYPLTVAISQRFLSPDSIVGLIYPSVASADGFNVVMKPAAAMRHFEIASVKIVQIEKRLGKKLKLLVENIPKSIAPDGSIIWSD